MFQTLKNAWRMADLRKKILFSLFILLLYRIGSNIPVPFVNAAVVGSIADSSQGLMQYLNILSGGAFSNATLFALNISPYIMPEQVFLPILQMKSMMPLHIG